MSKAGKFLQPWTAGSVKDYSDNKNYAVGVNIITEWDADFTNATIALNQDNNPGDAQGGPSVVLEESYNKTTWGWKVSYEGMDPAYNNVFYFSVTEGKGGATFTGHYFNISDALSTTSSSTSAASSTASSTSFTTISSTTPASSGSTTSQPTSPATIATITVAPSSDGRMPAGTTAGIVVAIVVGTFLLVGATWWAWKIKKKRTTAATAQPLDVASGQPHFYTEQKVYEADTNQIHALHETDGTPTCELQGSVRQPCK